MDDTHPPSSPDRPAAGGRASSVWRRRLTGWPAAVLVIAVSWLLAVTSVSSKSPTFDEPAHLLSGLSAWRNHDYRLNPEGGTLGQRWAALPLAVGDTVFPSTTQEAWRESRQWTLGRQLFYDLDNDLAAMLWLARAFTALLGAATLAIIYGWSRRLFGPGGGLLSVSIAALCPNLLAHGRLVTADMAVTATMLAAVGALWSVLHRVSPGTIVLSCLALGLALLAKFSALLLGPIAIILAIVRIAAGKPMTLGWLGRSIVVRGRRRVLPIVIAIAVAHAGAAWAIVWAGYGFRYSAFNETVATPPDEHRFYTTWDELLEDGGLVAGAVVFARDHRLLPQAYLHGLAFVGSHSASHSAFLNGEFRKTGWWYFFPYCFLVKTPLGLFVLLLLAVFAAGRAWRGPPAEDRRVDESCRGLGRLAAFAYATTPLWVLLAVYWSLAISTNMNIGLRHVLPTYPVLYIFVGAAARWVHRDHRLLGAAVVLAAVSVAGASLRAWPDYLAFFNSTVGARNGWRHLVDSSLDWGQDLDRLRVWLDENDLNDRDAPVWLSYFGSADPARHGLEVRRLACFFDWRSAPTRPVFPLEAGTYCISATMLQCVYHEPHLPWTDELEARYRAQREMIAPVFVPGSPRGRMMSDPRWMQQYRVFERLRFTRLCAQLQTREPDHTIGHSILVFHLDQPPSLWEGSGEGETPPD